MKYKLKNPDEFNAYLKSVQSDYKPLNAKVSNSPQTFLW